VFCKNKIKINQHSRTKKVEQTSWTGNSISGENCPNISRCISYITAPWGPRKGETENCPNISRCISYITAPWGPRKGETENCPNISRCISYITAPWGPRKGETENCPNISRCISYITAPWGPRKGETWANTWTLLSRKFATVRQISRNLVFKCQTIFTVLSKDRATVA
jgi:hypothetical protein